MSRDVPTAVTRSGLTFSWGCQLSSELTFNLSAFLKAVERRVDETLDDPEFDPSQRELLKATVAVHRPKFQKNPLCDPLALFYLIGRAREASFDEQGRELATFCQLYLLSLDVFDDVQDEDLEGKPHGALGPAIAINVGIALMFLSLRALSRGMALETDPERQLSYLRLFNEVSVLAVSGQHRDLMGDSVVRTPADVLAMQQAKTSSLALVCECAAIFARCDQAERARYRRIGENLARFVQVVDDVRDVYGKKQSPDLSTGKMTYPLACFFEVAGETERARFETLRAELPGSLGAVRSLFYEAGVIRRVAASLETFRRNIARELVATGNFSASHRTLAFVIDGLASAVYRPPALRETEPLRHPQGSWHARVRSLAQEFTRRMADFGMPPAPPLVPWHLPQWMYDPDSGLVYYPDVEGQPEETLPFQAELLGTDDLAEARRAVEATAPALVAHELVHYWRHASGALGRDAWHEELVANAVALSYCAKFAPDALDASLRFARAALERGRTRLSAAGRAVLDRLFQGGPAPAVRGYGVDMVEMTTIHLVMIERLAVDVPEPAEAVERYVGRPTPTSTGVAA